METLTVSPPAVSLTCYSFEVAIFRVKLSNIEMSIVCHLGGPVDYSAALVKLKRALTYGSPAELEACTDVFVTYEHNCVAVLQCGSFNTLDHAYKLISGLKVKVPLDDWLKALAAMLGALNDAPRPFK
jgi:hypothetical protein